MKTLFFFRITLCLIIVLLTGCAFQSIEITSFPSTFKFNDMNIMFSGYKLDKYDITFDICFSPPSDAIWLFARNIMLHLEC